MRLSGGLLHGEFNLNKLYYLSVHTLDGIEGTKYGKNRICRDLLDSWVEKKFGFGGIFFSDGDESLTEEDHNENIWKPFWVVIRGARITTAATSSKSNTLAVQEQHVMSNINAIEAIIRMIVIVLVVVGSQVICVKHLLNKASTK